MTIRRSSLLYDEAPIAISPTMCRLFGLQTAVFLQQLHYWLDHKAASHERYRDDFINGQYWVYWTQEQLQKAIPLGKSVDPHKRIIKELLGLGVLLVEQHKARSWNRTNYYSINYECLDEYIARQLSGLCTESGGNPADRVDGFRGIEEVKLPVSTSDNAAEFKKTNITTKTSSKKTTTTDVVVGADEIIKSLYLSASAERYRSLIERNTADLDKDIAQDVADEVSGTIRAIEQGRREDIFSFGKWIPALCRSASQGELVAQYGPTISNLREATKLAESSALKKSIDDEAAQVHRAEDIRVASEVISIIDEQALAALVSSVVVNFPFKSLRQKVADALLARQLPDGAGRVEAIKLLKCLQDSAGDAHERHI